MPGLLVICATPIGNLGDVPVRLAEELQQADVIYAEDTRRTGRLLAHLGIRGALRSYFVGNEDTRADELAERLAEGRTVALVTDAGMPGLADPGYTAVKAAERVGAQVTVVPGPSAVTAALAVSGLPSDRFVFEGFLPRKGVARTERLGELADEARTIVLFSSKSRLVTDLRDLGDVLGHDRRCAVVRELTKMHEEVWRGTLSEAAEHWAAAEPRGEFTLVVGRRMETSAPLGEAVEEAVRRIEEGTSTSQAVRDVAEQQGVSRRTLYTEVIRRRP
jgi:16S rRNA (cytidine1402-2'-O)-methyltransferase